MTVMMACPYRWWCSAPWLLAVAVGVLYGGRAAAEPEPQGQLEVWLDPCVEVDRREIQTALEWGLGAVLVEGSTAPNHTPRVEVRCPKDAHLELTLVLGAQEGSLSRGIAWDRQEDESYRRRWLLLAIEELVEVRNHLWAPGTSPHTSHMVQLLYTRLTPLPGGVTPNDLDAALVLKQPPVLEGFWRVENEPESPQTPGALLELHAHSGAVGADDLRAKIGGGFAVEWGPARVPWLRLRLGLDASYGRDEVGDEGSVAVGLFSSEWGALASWAWGPVVLRAGPVVWLGWVHMDGIARNGFAEGDAFARPWTAVGGRAALDGRLTERWGWRASAAAGWVTWPVVGTYDQESVVALEGLLVHGTLGVRWRWF
ncbi:MAG: hypothetical protein AAFX99_11370 [Myxococcota bacterium]